MNIRLLNQEFSVCQVEDYSLVNMNIPYCFPQKQMKKTLLSVPQR